MEQRLDRLIEEVKEVQRPYMNQVGAGDVVIVNPFLISGADLRRRQANETAGCTRLDFALLL